MIPIVHFLEDALMFSDSQQLDATAAAKFCAFQREIGIINVWTKYLPTYFASHFIVWKKVRRAICS
jgi:hypothetical protein